MMGYFNVGSIGGLINRVVPKPIQQFTGIFRPDRASLGLGALLYGAEKVGNLTDRFGITPSRQDIGRMSEGASKIGKNYTVGGIQYDFRTGRPINAPQSVFIPARKEPPAQPFGFSDGEQQAGQVAPPAPVLPTGPGVVSNGAGVPAQRQNVQDRALSQEILNAAQQYAAPAGVPLSSFYAGQQQLGRSMEQTGELQRQLKELGGATGMTDQALMSWAQANPGLAYQQLQKLKARSGQ